MGRGRSTLIRCCTVGGCGREHRAKGLCSTHWNRRYGRPSKYLITCVVCGAEHQSARKDGKFCSDECRAVNYKTRGCTPPLPSRRSLARLKMMNASKGRSGRYPWVCGTCSWCGGNFVARRPSGGAARFCSRNCSHYAVAARRRARKRGNGAEPYARQEIFRRDGWRCHICRKAVRRSVVAPHPLAPTIDHLVPIARGGADAPWNVATAHFLCNSIKGDRGGGEQLMLAG